MGLRRRLSRNWYLITLVTAALLLTLIEIAVGVKWKASLLTLAAVSIFSIVLLLLLAYVLAVLRQPMANRWLDFWYRWKTRDVTVEMKKAIQKSAHGYDRNRGR